MSKLKKFAIVTEQAQPQGGGELITYKDNLLQSAYGFLKTKYPWLKDSVAVKFVEVKPKEAFAYAVCDVTFPNSPFILQFPLIFSNGEFMDVPSFYSPESKLFIPFNEDWFKLIVDNISESAPMGKLTNYIDMPGPTDYAFRTSYYNNTLSRENPNYYPFKYGALLASSMLSLFPASILKSLVKTSSNKHPELIKEAYSALRLSEIKYNAKLTKRLAVPVTKKASASIIPIIRPTPIFLKQSHAIDLPESVAKKYNLDRRKIYSGLSKAAYYAPDGANVPSFTVSEKDMSLPLNAEIKSRTEIEAAIRSLGSGKATVITDEVKGRTYVFVNPRGLLSSNYGTLENTDNTMRHEPTKRTYYSNTHNPITSLTEVMNLSVPTDRAYFLDNTNYVVKTYNYAKRAAILDAVFSEDMTFKYLKKLFTIVFGDSFVFNKVYELTEFERVQGLDLFKCGNTIFSLFQRAYLFGVSVDMGDLGNGYNKLTVYKISSMHSSVQGVGKSDPRKTPVLSFVINKDTDKVEKIKILASNNKPGVEVYSSADNPFKCIAIDNIPTKEEEIASMGSTVSVDLKSPDNLSIVSGNYLGEDVVQNLFSDAACIIKNMIKGIPVNIKRDEKTVEGDYRIIFDRDAFRRYMDVKVAGVKDLALVFGMLGVSGKDIDNIVKKAETTSDFTFSLVPNAAYGKAATGGTSEQALAEQPSSERPSEDGTSKEYLEVIEKQIDMLFKYIQQQMSSVEKGMADREAILAKQLELLDSKIQTVEEVRASLEDTNKRVEEVYQEMDKKISETAATQVSAAPQEAQASGIAMPPAAPTAPSAGAQPAAAPTIDDQTAQMLAQALIDPNAAAQQGIDQQTVAMLNSATNGDQQAMQQLGINDQDVYLISQQYNNMVSQQQTSAAAPAPAQPAPAGAPAQAGAPAPAPVAGQPQAQPALQQEMAPQMSPTQVQEQADMLAVALVDPRAAAQQGISEQDLNYLRQVIEDPYTAKNQGEDPMFVDALLSAYNRVIQSYMMSNADLTSQNSAIMDTPATDRGAGAAAQLESSGAADEAMFMRNMTMLGDLIPKIKSSKLFFKYINNFKSMLSILGELLFSLELQSTKYQKILGDSAFNETIDLLQGLYEQFGEFILKMYTMEKQN